MPILTIKVNKRMTNGTARDYVQDFLHMSLPAVKDAFLDTYGKLRSKVTIHHSRGIIKVTVPNE